MPTVSVVVASYNEQHFIREVIEHCLQAPLPEAFRLAEVIVVNDGSVDGTRKILETFQSHPRVKVRHMVENHGKGHCLRVGFAIAEGDVVIVQDADWEYNPRESFFSLLAPFFDPRVDVVYGSRFLMSRWPLAMPWPNLVMNYLLSSIVNVMYGVRITDEATCYKVFRREILSKMTLRAERFEFCPEFTSKILKLGISIHEVPVVYRARTTNEGKKIRVRDAVQAIAVLLRERFR